MKSLAGEWLVLTALGIGLMAGVVLLVAVVFWWVIPAVVTGNALWAIGMAWTAPCIVSTATGLVVLTNSRPRCDNSKCNPVPKQGEGTNNN